jgi:hypothetical protein
MWGKQSFKKKFNGEFATIKGISCDDGGGGLI